MFSQWITYPSVAPEVGLWLRVGISLASADFGGEASLEFDMWGHVRQPGTVVLKWGQKTKRISVEGLLGKVTVE